MTNRWQHGKEQPAIENDYKVKHHEIWIKNLDNEIIYMRESFEMIKFRALSNWGKRQHARAVFAKLKYDETVVLQVAGISLLG